MQTLSGAGAISLGLTLLKEQIKDMKYIYVSSPTWTNHLGISERVGFEPKEYQYYDKNTQGLDFEGMIASLK